MQNLNQLFQDLQHQATDLQEELDELESRHNEATRRLNQMQSFMHSTERTGQITVLNNEGASGDSMIVCWYKVGGRNLMLILTEVEEEGLRFLGHVLDVNEKIPLYANTVHPESDAYDKEELFSDLIAQYANWELFENS